MSACINDHLSSETNYSIPNGGHVHSHYFHEEHMTYFLNFARVDNIDDIIDGNTSFSYICWQHLQQWEYDMEWEDEWTNKQMNERTTNQPRGLS